MPRVVFLILTVVCVFALCWPDINFYPQLSQGDHGRDLYAAQEILRGKVPYQDFWWVYGPLMPYYYALFYKLTGGTVVSFLIGKAVLETLCAAFVYLGAAVFMAPSLAFVCAMWFSLTQQDFFFTFNHIGGIAAELWILYMLFLYITRREIRFAWMTLPAILAYGLIKINFGIAALAATALVIALVDIAYKTAFDAPKKKLAIALLTVVPAAWLVIYWLFLKDLPSYAVHQCMPYFGDDQPHHAPPSVTVPYYLTQHWLTLYHQWMGFKNVWSTIGAIHSPVQWVNVFFNVFMLPLAVVMHASTIATFILLGMRRLTSDETRRLRLAMACLLIFFILNFHEFIVSGVWYRSYWSLPFLLMFHYVCMATASRLLPALVRRIIWTILGILIGLGFMVGILSNAQQKTPPHFLGGPHGKVFIANEPRWTETVNAAAAFLNSNLKKDETFFALPYDCIYYYLTNTESPTRQLIFFDHIKIPPEQEMSVIRELESKNVAYVLMSNRIAASETGLGVFGKTYCPLIARYIEEKYTPVGRQGGNWNEEPGWGHNHGVLILKRK